MIFMRSIRIRVFFVFIAICLFPAVSWGASVSSSVPLNSWVYPALDKLAGMGYVDSGIEGNRPYNRLEAARRIQEVDRLLKRVEETTQDQSTDQDRIHPVVRELLSRLKKEFDFELSELKGRSIGYIKPIRDLCFDYIYREGQNSTMPLASYSGTDQFSLNYNNDGISYTENSNFQLTFETQARLGSFLMFDIRPLVLFNDNQEDELAIDTLAATAALGLGPIEISFGRQALWWGQGHHGTLILTNNAKPLTMLRITNPQPILLPWVFKYLGPFRFDLFFSRLGEERVVPDPSFSGLRLNIKPLPWLEIGVSRTIMFGGEGRPEMDFGDYLTILSGKNLSGDEDTSNQLAALDMKLQFPFLWNAQLYAETGGEDEAGGFPMLNAWIVGCYLPQIEPSNRLSLRLEVANLATTRSPGGPWYAHSQYQSGYTYETNIMGHHVGSAAIDHFAEIELRLPQSITLTTSIDYEIRGYGESEKETHLQYVFNAEWAFASYFSLHFDYRLDQVDGYNFIQGANRTFHYASIGFSLYW